ncbi:MAG TPA: UDP-N-acetylmuramoyl-tripeptide--D-alanyl-D-alanine ligase [Blastocatellia bacterium]|nr:UDP-N-acetylmuramoyl-tripeptide--D-alanyl-D-alanine ligase [Blastocatellia bacterium]
MTLGEIVAIIGARPCDPALAEVEPTGFSIDSRTIRPGELFFAITGTNKDGHDFVGDALQKGACAAVVGRDVSGVDLRRQIRVADPLVALQGLAREVRRRWGKPVIGITGSSGKTMTKELTALMLSADGARVVKTVGNYNNAYGLPLSLLQMISDGRTPADYDYAVLEMGMSAPGEITHLCRIAQPTVGVVTNVGAAHLAFFPSVEAIAEAKAELVDNLPADGLAILNADDPRVARMRWRQPIAVRTFGIESEADVRARELRIHGLEGMSFQLITPRGQVEVRTSLLGRHQVANIVAAAAVADYFHIGLEAIARAVAHARPYTMRGEILRFPQHFVVIDDSYNSNPRALAEMVATVASVNGVARRIVVAGEMLELGEHSAELHRQCGREIARRGIDLLLGVRGDARELIAGAREAGMPEEATRYVDTPEDAARWLFDNVRSGDLVLVKGSRGVRLDQVVARLKHVFMGEGT